MLPREVGLVLRELRLITALLAEIRDLLKENRR